METMAKGSVFKNIFMFSIPIIIGSVFQQAYNMIDTFIIGRTLGINEVAGVGSTGVIYFLMICLVIGISNGAGVVISQYFGVSDKKNVNESIASTAIVLGILAILVMLLGVLCTKNIVHFMKIPMESVTYAEKYLVIISGLCFGNVLYNGASTVLRSFGDSKTPLYAIIFASVLNIILDYVFIVYAHMGVSAAAMATVISQFGSGIWCLLYLVIKREKYGLSLPDMKITRKMIWRIVKMGVPTAFQSCMISVGGILVQRLIDSFGVDVLGAYATANKIDNMAIQIICSFGTALSVFTGQNIGYGQYDRIKRGLRVTLMLNFAAAFIMAVVAFVFGKQIMELFLGENATSVTIYEGAVYLRVMGIAYIICGIMQSYQNIIRGSGDANISLITGMAELGARIVFAYILSYFFGSIGIWIATPISWGCGCIVPVIRYYTGNWKKHSVFLDEKISG